MALVLELLHLDHFGKAIDSPDERILDGLAHAAGEGHESGGIELLVAEEDHLVLEERLANFRFGKLAGELDAEELGPERAGDLADLQARAYSSLIFAFLMMAP